jgi:tRNA pseudouridine32 synthase/23S rRNA pseudouridine746 synthase
MHTVDIDIIDHQEDFLVVDKPANINFHDEENLGSGFYSQVKKFAISQLNIAEIFPVHRLDKMTSGLMIFAKDINSARAFQLLFEQHQVQKFYLAIADGKPKKKQGLIKGDMEKSRRGMWKLMRTMNNPAISQFQSYNIAPKRRLYLVKPHSGKTHQIRVALNSIGVPILGDPLYNSSIESDRGYLHAFALGFTLNNENYQYCHAPRTGEEFNNAEAISTIKKLIPAWQQAWPDL